jgi:hypothetical protein
MGVSVQWQFLARGASAPDLQLRHDNGELRRGTCNGCMEEARRRRPSVATEVAGVTEPPKL